MRVILKLVLFVVLCVLAAVMIVPRIIKLNVRSPRSEVRSNLKGAWSAERSFSNETNRYTEHPLEAGFVPERSNRYLYLFSSLGRTQQRSAQAITPDEQVVGIAPDTFKYPAATEAEARAGIPPSLLREVGVSGTCPACEVTVVAAGNIDQDATIDVWSISSVDRVADDGTRIDAGRPWNHIDDQAD